MTLPDIDSDTVNGIAGIVALVNSLMLVPSIMALRKIAEKHEGRLEKLEKKPPKKRARR
jgi:hypothetical protein